MNHNTWVRRNDNTLDILQLMSNLAPHARVCRLSTIKVTTRLFPAPK